MATISNRILISAVNDGETIHGSLRATKSLTQGWTGATAIPDWTAPGDYYHPMVYLTLYNGTTQIPPLSYEWYYNGTLLTFGSDHISTGTYAGYFYDSYEDPDGAGQGVGQCRCLTIYRNLASSNNLDIDLISIKGTVEVGGASVPFEAGIDVTISRVDSSGYLGVLNFTNGKSTLDGDSDTVTINASLFYAGGNPDAWTCTWHVNGDSNVISQSIANNAVLSNNGKSLTLYGRYVTDIATVVCKFYCPATVSSANLQTSAMVVVDDIGDPEYLYIRYTMSGGSSTNDGAPVSLHTGQSVSYKMWVARSDDSNSTDFTSRTTKIEVQPHGADGTRLSKSAFASLSSLTADSDGFVNITASTTNDAGTTITGGVFAVTYAEVSAKSGTANLNVAGNASFIVRATLSDS